MVLPTGRADIGQRCLMLGARGREDIGAVGHVGNDLLVLAVIDRPRLGGEIGDPPAVSVLFQKQVDEAEMRAPEAGHDGRFCQAACP